MEKQIILPENVELTEETRTIYKDRDGRYYLSKQGAQDKLATHFKCNCGKGIRERHRVYCDACEPPKAKPPARNWDGKSMLYVSTFDQYFNNVEEIEEYCETEGVDKHTIDVFECEGNYLSEVSEDYWEDVFAEDGELPKEIRTKLDELNQAIKNYEKPMSWSPSKYIANFEWND